jgi:hypothetical protein
LNNARHLSYGNFSDELSAKLGGAAMARYARPAIFSLFAFLGLGIMVVSGDRLDSRLGTTWELAGFAVGILLTAIFVTLSSEKRINERINELEKKVSDLISTKGGQ